MPTTIDRARLATITTLGKGKHDPDGEYCIMELVSVLAGETWTDRPQCACPVITEAAIWLNDIVLNDGNRHLLIPFGELIAGSRATSAVEARRQVIADQAQSAYRAAIAPARSAYDAAIAPARSAYDAAWTSAEHAYQAAIAPARSAYDAAIASAEHAYQAAIAPARSAYDAAIASARSAYDAAIASAQMAALSALSEILAITDDIAA